MKLLLIFIIFSSLFSNCSLLHRGINGGWYCAGCTFVIGVLEQASVVNNRTVTDTIERLCDKLPNGGYKIACNLFANDIAPIITDLLTYAVTSDEVCNLLKICYLDEQQPQCTLYNKPLKKLQRSPQQENVLRFTSKMKSFVASRPGICKLPIMNKICDFIEEFGYRHEPAFDTDGDMFSVYEGLRGTAWRGKDCDDWNSDIYPGAKSIDSDIQYDTNCNGIYGVDKNGQSYEEKFCSNTSHKGVAILGDSATAHFHFPDEWANATKLSDDILIHLRFAIENEFDWPMMSWGSGYRNITWPILHGPVHSIYSKLRERNLCNHRDYQNIAVNGADSHDLLHYQESLSRKSGDVPMLVIYAMVGNDVCNGYPDTISHMTTVKQMRENVMNTLKFLNKTLPANSHILFVGLAQAGAFFKYMQNRIHPVGALRNDVTYAQLYEYLTCLQVNPCNGWLTTNETLRSLTDQRAADLSKVLSDISKAEKFANFDINYMPNPINQVFDDWIKKHGPGSFYQLVEPVDGFHPNQITNSLVANYGWKYLMEKLPHYVGEENKFNEKIREIFGDQGGY